MAIKDWETDRYYHVFNHANGNEKLFVEADNYKWFLHQYDSYINPVADTFAYCLLPNHFHFLIKLKNSLELLKAFPKFETLEKLEDSHLPSKQFSNLFSSYTQGFNKKYHTKGSLFLKNFKRRLINSDTYISTAIAYIHLNPVFHGFVSQPEAWPWSSYNTVLGDAPTRLKRTQVLEWFGNKEQLIAHHIDYRHSKTGAQLEPDFLMGELG
jgi:REP element-mobilizing transposase RayT